MGHERKKVMPTESQRLELRIDPRRLASVINGAVFATIEVVNFHLRALESANLEAPAEAGNLRFRINAPEITAVQRRAMHETWILARAFHELLRAVRHSLEEAYVLVIPAYKNTSRQIFCDPF
jgi:hypothetical protein